MGIVAPNANTLQEFDRAIRNGISGIRFLEELDRLNFSCRIAGKPMYDKNYLDTYFTTAELKGLNASGLAYGVIAGIDAWKDADLPIQDDKSQDPFWDYGTIFGTGILGVDKFREAIYKVDEGKVRRLGSTTVPQTMASGISAFLGGKLSLGNLVTTNSAACTTGTEAILMGYERIKYGKAKVMLTGGTSDGSPYVWGGFDAMRILAGTYNSTPEKASRPMSATAKGFVPGSGAGALVLEEYEHAKKRGAKIYAEIIGGHSNSGGQQKGGSMTAPNSNAVIRCLREAVKDAEISPDAIDAINGHLTATTKDTTEIKNWSDALDRKGDNFPYINSLKSLTGHCLSASGSMETIAAILQLKNEYIFGNTNCEDLHPEIDKLVSKKCIPRETIPFQANIIAKASFGFGDVNACLILKKYT